MSEESNIQWTDSTGGPWLVCSEVSPGCAHCYARDLMLRRLKVIVRKAYKKAGFADWETRKVWGDEAPRIMTKGFWTEARRLNAKATPGEPHRMFPSLIDWLDDMPMGCYDQEGNEISYTTIFLSFMHLVRTTENLRWMLCTKRPENFSRLFKRAIESGRGEWHQSKEGYRATMDWMERWINFEPPKNVHLLCSVENQNAAIVRLDSFLAIPAVHHGLSLEPLLGNVELDEWLWKLPDPVCADCPKDIDCECGFKTAKQNGFTSIDWMIIGGESGPKARECNVEWIRNLIVQGNGANVPVFVKQLGAKPTSSSGWHGPLKMVKDKKGGLMSEWPEDLQIRQWPEDEKFNK